MTEVTEKMAAERATVIEKLKQLRQTIPELRDGGRAMAQTPELTVWRRDVMKWLKMGGLYTHDELMQFANTRFESPAGDWSELRWGEPSSQGRYVEALIEADHLLQSAIENLEQDLVAPPSRSPASATQRDAPPAMNRIEINNANIINISVGQVLEAVAQEIEKKDPKEGARFRDTLKNWVKKDLLEAVLNASVQGILNRGS